MTRYLTPNEAERIRRFVAAHPRWSSVRIARRLRRSRYTVWRVINGFPIRNMLPRLPPSEPRPVARRWCDGCHTYVVVWPCVACRAKAYQAGRVHREAKQLTCSGAPALCQ